MASFQAKVSWKSPRNGENKNFIPTRRVIEKSKKIAKKLKKFKNVIKDSF